MSLTGEAPPDANEVLTEIVPTLRGIRIESPFGNFQVIPWYACNTMGQRLRIVPRYKEQHVSDALISLELSTATNVGTVDKLSRRSFHHLLDSEGYEIHAESELKRAGFIVASALGLVIYVAIKTYEKLTAIVETAKLTDTDQPLSTLDEFQMAAIFIAALVVLFLPTVTLYLWLPYLWRYLTKPQIARIRISGQGIMLHFKSGAEKLIEIDQICGLNKLGRIVSTDPNQPTVSFNLREHGAWRNFIEYAQPRLVAVGHADDAKTINRQRVKRIAGWGCSLAIIIVLTEVGVILTNSAVIRFFGYGLIGCVPLMYLSYLFTKEPEDKTANNSQKNKLGRPFGYARWRDSSREEIAGFTQRVT